MLCCDSIEQAFAPDLNSMEPQDKKELNNQKKEALKLLDRVFESTASVEHEDEKIKRVVQESLDNYHKTVADDARFFKKSLKQDVEKIYRYYLSVLTLVIAIAEAAKADKKIKHTNFVNNRWVQGLQNSNDLKKEALRLNAIWDNKFDRVQLWLRDVVKQDNEYMTFLDKKSPSLDDQKRILNHVFRKVILGKTVINDYFEEEVLHWSEDREIVKGMVEKTVKSYDPASGEPLHLHQLSLNWEDDLHFIEYLYSGSINLDPEYGKLIADNTRNWEVDRLPLIDRVILEMAITEMLSFPSIPVKVTMNEYIELAKNYSTPKSRQFINGILDVITKRLKSEGKIKKSGRGLMDNK